MAGIHSEPALALDLIGPMALRRDGCEVALPASKKTRALLAYLALASRPVRRDALCALLWEMPDDPRGALRWSLSKLRGLLGGGAALAADRDTVFLDKAGLSLDWDRLCRATEDCEAVPLAELRELALGEGEFLEGLDLPHCDHFQTWTVALREDGQRWQARLLQALVDRDGDHETRLAAARRWVQLRPFEAEAKAVLAEVQAAADRAAPARRVDATPASAPPMHPDQQQIRFCTASDGTGLAWSRVGEGPPLVKTANWLNHLEYDWDSPVWRHWISALTEGRSLIRYDERGNGLSDWDAEDISFEAFVDDLSSVVDAAGLDSFDLLGVSQGCSVSIAYAIRNPHRVRRMILYGGYAAGWRGRRIPGEIERREAMTILMRTGWGQNNPAFRQVFTTLFFPDASQVEMDWFNELQRMTTSPANAIRLSEAFSHIDVRDIMAQVPVPTLVLHARDDAVAPFSEGRLMASTIPDAQFVVLESRNHLLMPAEPAWARFIASVQDFLG